MKQAVRILLISVIIITSLAFIALILGAAYLTKFKECQIDDALLNLNKFAEKTEFYRYEFSDREARSGKAVLIEDSYLDNGIRYRYVSYAELPQNLINAFIAVEDKHFEEHNGIDFYRTGRAAVNYIFGDGSFGGSTITQQLVKNLTGHDENTIERKISEAFCAIDLEKKCDKTEIMELYLNVINLSQGCRGVGAAAEYFYSKQPKHLTLSECATIAAITNNPSAYDPVRHPENNIKRRNIILKCMLDQGFIDQNDYDSAINDGIMLKLSEKAVGSKINSWYIDAVTEDVIQDLAFKYEISEKAAASMLYRGGFRIYTAMHQDVQNILEEYYTNVFNFPIDSEGEMPQSSMIVIDPYTGDVLGIAGAVGEKRGNRVQNYATKTKRPPGSTIKPLSVYSIALEKGLIDWATIVEDSPIGETGWPSNVDNLYVGPVDIKYAIEHSLNTVAVKLLKEVGEQEAFDFLQDSLRIESLDRNTDMGLASLALGQPSKGITLRELTAAYSIFEEGIMSKPRTYFKVTDAAGAIILDNPSEQESVLSIENAAIMTKLLQAVVDTGTASGGITLNDRIEVAGKSGTSQNNCDRLFVGYTPELLAGVWLGYDYPKDLSEFGGNLSVYIWDEVMTKIYERTEYGGLSRFYIPDSLQKLTYHRKNGTIPPDTNDPSLIDNGWFAPHNPD